MIRWWLYKQTVITSVQLPLEDRVTSRCCEVLFKKLDSRFNRHPLSNKSFFKHKQKCSHYWSVTIQVNGLFLKEEFVCLLFINIKLISRKTNKFYLSWHFLIKYVHKKYYVKKNLWMLHVLHFICLNYKIIITTKLLRKSIKILKNWICLQLQFLNR